MTLLCVPIFVDSPAQGLADAVQAAEHGADLVEFRIDRCFDGAIDSCGTGVPPVFPSSPTEPDTDWSPLSDADLIAALQQLIAHSPLPVILTCRPTWEGGEYDGDDADRVALFEKLTAASPSPPAYLDVELAAYTRSANLRQKINLCVAHPKQQRDVPTRLILSTHDFQGRPADLTRKLAAAYAEPAAAIVKVAFRARSLRDNLELFDLLESPPKPTIALGMGEFGLMSRVLAPKFNGFLTFASLRDESATAPGQPTLDELLNLYRFRSITKTTKLYGVIGWPVTQSMSPLIHNAGFTEVGHDGVYLPLPIAADPDNPKASATSFNATVGALIDHPALGFAGASITIPHKEHAARYARDTAADRDDFVTAAQVANTYAASPRPAFTNTDIAAIDLLDIAPGDWPDRRIGIVGAGGVARALAFDIVRRGGTVVLYNRTQARSKALAHELNATTPKGKAVPAALDLLPKACCDTFINCTPLGMTNGPDTGPWGGALSIPIPDMPNITADTVFFDTVYNPIETPMLKAARERGCRTIDGVQMFVKQAAAQFELWTNNPAPEPLFDRLVREKLSTGD